MKSNLQHRCWLYLAAAALTMIHSVVYAVPGDDPACVSVNGTANYSINTTMKFDLGGETECTEHDQLTFDDLNLQGGTLQIRLITGYVPAGGEVFDVLNWGTLNGTFAEPFDFSQAALSGGLTWDTSQLYTTGEIAIISGALSKQVPLPIWMLMCLALGILSLSRLACFTQKN